jgi:hypothetical protein
LAAVLGGLFLVSVLAGWVNRQIALQQKLDEADLSELRDLLARIGGYDAAAPEHAFERLGRALCKPGGHWRLSLYLHENQDGESWLRRVLRRSDYERFENSGREMIEVSKSVLREIETSGFPLLNEAAEAPDPELDRESWLLWQVNFLRDREVAEALVMPSRKYAWFAFREAGGNGRTIALVVETVHPAGINFDYLKSPLMEPLLAQIVALTELRGLANPVVVRSQGALRR